MEAKHSEIQSQVVCAQSASQDKNRVGDKERRRGCTSVVVGALALALAACSTSVPPETERADIAEPARHLFPAPVLTSPAEGATLVGTQPVFAWEIDRCKERVLVELCADADCDAVKLRFEADTCTGSRAPTELVPGTYFWHAARVRGQHLASSFSRTHRFVLAPPAPVVTADLWGVWSVSASDVFAVGAAGTILRYSGAWAAETSPTTQTLRAVWATNGGQAFAVGDGGTILRRDGNTWAAVASPTSVDLQGVWGSSASDVWVAGGSLILHWNGTSFSVSHDRMAGSLRGVFGTSAIDVWVTGSGKEPDGDYAALLLHWNGTSWSESYVCNPEGTRFSSGGWIASLTDIWGLRSGALWAAGVCQSGASFIPFGYVAHKDSGSWADVPGFGFGQPLGERRPLRTIWASSASDVWAASGNETVSGTTLPTMLHFDGTSWTPSPQAITVGIYDLGGTTASDVWAVGKAGKRLHFDGTTWSAMP
jgi:hypothetical protein